MSRSSCARREIPAATTCVCVSSLPSRCQAKEEERGRRESDDKRIRQQMRQQNGSLEMMHSTRSPSAICATTGRSIAVAATFELTSVISDVSMTWRWFRCREASEESTDEHDRGKADAEKNGGREVEEERQRAGGV